MVPGADFYFIGMFSGISEITAIGEQYPGGSALRQESENCIGSSNALEKGRGVCSSGDLGIRLKRSGDWMLAAMRLQSKLVRPRWVIRMKGGLTQCCNQTKARGTSTHTNDIINLGGRRSGGGSVGSTIACSKGLRHAGDAGNASGQAKERRHIWWNVRVDMRTDRSATIDGVMKLLASTRYK